MLLFVIVVVALTIVWISLASCKLKVVFNLPLLCSHDVGMRQVSRHVVRAAASGGSLAAQLPDDRRRRSSGDAAVAGALGRGLCIVVLAYMLVAARRSRCSAVRRSSCSTVRRYSCAAVRRSSRPVL